jgi:hypothetical protein
MKKFITPAAPGTVLKKPDKGKEILMPAKQTQYYSGVGKGMHMMQYSWPDTYNAVGDLARHITLTVQVHYDTMLRMMKYVNDNTKVEWEQGIQVCHQWLKWFRLCKRYAHAKEHLWIQGTFGRCTCDVQEFNAELCCIISF